ncbi:phospholipase YtpA [Benincasa hispida]|uniref:phospholipase YtpA n=1 Tax=Benincasa hispida TaxID=102211 RepID=UPI001900FD28|nr:phospholipase YtpA [Benincasa hispida]
MAVLPSIHSISFFQPKIPTPKPIVRANAELIRPQKMRVPFKLKEEQNRIFHELPSGLQMEVIVQKGSPKSAQSMPSNVERPPLIFLHGSYHAAWSWAEHWLPFFSASGFDCYAISLLGQGESDTPSASVAGTLQTHASDIADFIHRSFSTPPVLLGHSFGGLIVQYYIANSKHGDSSDAEKLFPRLTGAVLICSVPPSGNSGLVQRYLFTKPIAAFKVTLSLAAKAFQTSLPLCKETFFSVTMEDHLVLRYQELMKKSSRMPLFDLRKLNASLPVPSLPKSCIEVLVLGASDDFIVDAEGLNETGRFYGVTPICVQGVAHDMMLDCSWQKGAEAILTWLNCLRS